MGLGLFGGGVGAARYLAGLGAHVTVTDKKDAKTLAPSIKALEGLPVTFHLGGHSAADFAQAAAVVVNPAVDKKKSEFVAKAVAAGIEITSEMNLFIEACPAAVLGVTGSSGKSTTTALVGEMLRRSRPSRVGGNIGKSLLEELGAIGPKEWVVLELSSFQLEDLGPLGWSPQIALATNLSPNHIDRHGSMAAYVEAKRNIVRFQSPGAAAVLNADDEILRAWQADAQARGSRVVWFSGSRPLAEGVFADGRKIVFRLGAKEERLDLTGRIRLLGRHNLANIAAAAAAARLLDVPVEAIGDVVAGFRALRHRLEPAGRLGGVLFVNDSKATTPLAVRASLDAFDGPSVLIAGGRDKGMDMAPMIEAIRRKARAVVLIGEMAGAVAQAIGSGGPHVERAASLPEAVGLAAGLAQPGDVVLLAPGYTSWDMFDNYEQRGDAFRDAALRLGAEPVGP
ncbi:MAG: UDP-N-acetylmuramoyl-L-alanine--D-glutamate ligase [Planctomycetota bacterium]|nr:UDP-N-acetylmuramoyl-L-alanine--D-glutamate ligase [Planctomycetota bacterium]